LFALPVRPGLIAWEMASLGSIGMGMSVPEFGVS
jgi:hypothetical protein